MKNKFTYERVDDVFIYTMKTPNGIKHWVDINGNTSSHIEEGKTLKVNINVPKKKVVSTPTDIMDIGEALIIMKLDYVKEHTIEIDDVDKFEETHEKGYNILMENK